ncbi:hypothetical protein [Oceanomicrobium pacificus]|uniref:hypothetical protein n=1 Tax=Oceanomicrobium pacificus TaxID=2692916 RepID=UPI0019678705|nr:hypothetical protein [Oceanomicrobium pacificus]
MIILVAALIGVAWGYVRAKRAGGNTKDRLQYAAAHGLAFAVAGLFLSILLGHLLG